MLNANVCMDMMHLILTDQNSNFILITLPPAPQTLS